MKASEIIGKTCDGSWPHDGRRIGVDAIMDIRRATCPACGVDYNYLRPDQPCTVDWRGFPADVDDMAEWIDAQGFALDVFCNRNEGKRDIYGELRRYGTLMQNPIEFEGPTLSAALEAAVIVVHETTS